MSSTTTVRYGLAARTLHWGMAALIVFQLITAAAHWGLEDTYIESLLWPWHKPLGLLLFVVACLRVALVLASLGKRPASTHWTAAAGHFSLYVLMIVIPLVALIRQYGSGRAWELWGVSIFPGFDAPKIEWMVSLGNTLHGVLGWCFAALIVGHVAMVVAHRRFKRLPDVWPRMWGKSGSAPE